MSLEPWAVCPRCSHKGHLILEPEPNKTIQKKYYYYVDDKDKECGPFDSKTFYRYHYTKLSPNGTFTKRVHSFTCDFVRVRFGHYKEGRKIRCSLKRIRVSKNTSVEEVIKVLAELWAGIGRRPKYRRRWAGSFKRLPLDDFVKLWLGSADVGWKVSYALYHSAPSPARKN